MCTMSANAEYEAQGGRYLGRWEGLLEVMSLEVPVKCRNSYKSAELEAENSKF